MDFSQRLRKLRKERNIKQQTIADEIGVVLRTYQCYEQGTREPSLETVVRLARILQVTTDELLCDKQGPHSSE